ncbi:MAG TPA: trypsin-like peptidase domain-containing protein [Propionibacteriaceae bacterium]|nr:trypsin-like peptidase domain-containing protein [Propionibacteriaceae bacterium]
MSEQRPEGTGIDGADITSNTGFNGSDEQTWWGQDGRSVDPDPALDPGPADAGDAQVLVSENTVELPTTMEHTIQDIPTTWGPPEQSTPSFSDQDYGAAPSYAPSYASPGQPYPGYQPPAPQTYNASQDYWAPPNWTPTAAHPASGQMSASPQVTASSPRDKRRRGIGVATLVGVAAMAATLGGGTGYALSRALDPSTTSVSSSTTQPRATVTQVVQGNSSAPDWKVTAEAITGSVASIIVTDGQSGGQGSGVVLDTEGHIVTNNHVVADVATGAQATVIIGDNTYDATLVGTDPSTDLAVLQLVNPPSDLKPIGIADSSLVAVGDPVMAFGNPLGLADTATTGIVSAINRPVTTTASGTQNQGTSGADTVVTSAIQTSAMINPGNSGGALVNANGELIGITSSGATLTNSELGQSGSIGLGFAIPSNLVTTITDQLIENGTAKHAYVGISTNDATARLGDETIMGASVESVVSGTPADKAGLVKGDVITALNGISVASSESLVGQIRSLQPGEIVEMTVIRGGKESTVQVTLGSR